VLTVLARLGAMSFIKSRLRRLEDTCDQACPKCYHKLKRGYVYYPDEGQEPPEPPACAACGGSLGFVLKVVYEGGG
jgi:hypothetical protein